MRFACTDTLDMLAEEEVEEEAEGSGSADDAEQPLPTPEPPQYPEPPLRRYSLGELLEVRLGRIHNRPVA